MKGFQQQGNTLLFELKYEKLMIEPWGKDSLRLRASVGPKILMDFPGALLDPALSQTQIEISEDKAVIRNGKLTAEMLKDGHLRFVNNITGATLLEEEIMRPEERPGWPPARWYQGVQGELYKIEVRFQPFADEMFFGMGQQRHGRLNHKGSVIDLMHLNTRISIPFLLSTRGYGFLWNNPGIGRVELGNHATRWVAQATLQIDYWVTAGDTPAEILEQRFQLGVGQFCKERNAPHVQLAHPAVLHLDQCVRSARIIHLLGLAGNDPGP